MRKNFNTKPWLYPMPVLILAAYGENDEPMVMNVGWGGIAAKHMVMLGLGNNHKTTEYLLQSKAFTLSPATADQLVPCDYVGIDSGKNVPDKMQRTGFHVHKAQYVNAPILQELPFTLECELISYDPDAELLIGRIVNISADESILGEDGKIDADKAQFLTLDPSNLCYRTLGPVVGKAFHDGIVLSDKKKSQPFDDQK